MDSIRKQDYVALAQFRRALRRFVRYSEEGAREAGITPQQHQVLLGTRAFPERDWATIGEIADFLQLRHHATVGLVDRCQAADLVVRTSSPDDRRVVRVSLTPVGEEVLERLTRRNIGILRSLGPLAEAIDSAAREQAEA